MYKQTYRLHHILWQSARSSCNSSFPTGSLVPSHNHRGLPWPARSTKGGWPPARSLWSDWWPGRLKQHICRAVLVFSVRFGIHQTFACYRRLRKEEGIHSIFPGNDRLNDWLTGWHIKLKIETYLNKDYKWFKPNVFLTLTPLLD